MALWDIELEKKIVTKMINSWVWLQWINRDRTEIFKKTLLKQHRGSFYYQHDIKINDMDRRLRMKVCFKIILSLSPSSWPTHLFEAGDVNLLILAFCLLKKKKCMLQLCIVKIGTDVTQILITYLLYITMSEENTGNTNAHWWIGKGLFVYISQECIPQPAIESLTSSKLKYLGLFFSSN